MTDRIVDVSQGAMLRVRHDQLCVRIDEASEHTVPLEEVAVLVADHPALVYTHDVLARLAGKGGAFIACGRDHLPAALMLPLAAHHLHGERLRQQVNASLPTRKRCWQQLVRAKLCAQGQLLDQLYGDDAGLSALANRVASGDPDNKEAQGARRYWGRVFADATFRRNRDAEDQNRYLNYGYAVLRAACARAICAAGLHPGFGLHHGNRYDPFPLADDLMEPFRPIVDAAVVRAVAQFGATAELEKNVKAVLLQPFLSRFLAEGERRSLWDILARLAVSLTKVYAGETRQLTLPELSPAPIEPDDDAREV